MNSENNSAWLFDFAMITMTVKVMLKVTEMSINKFYSKYFLRKRHGHNLSIHMMLHFTMTRQ